jgi:hypothetical protein
MSTKTIYKRIALVAVAALGAGVLSVAPANAVAGSATAIAISLTTEDDGVDLTSGNYTSNPVRDANQISSFTVGAGSVVSLEYTAIGGTILNDDDELKLDMVGYGTLVASAVAAADVADGAEGILGDFTATLVPGTYTLRLTLAKAGTYSAATDLTAEVSMVVTAAATYSSALSTMHSVTGNVETAADATTNAVPLIATSTVAAANRAAITVTLRNSSNATMASGNTLTAIMSGSGGFGSTTVTADTPTDDACATPTRVKTLAADAVNTFTLCSDGTSGVGTATISVTNAAGVTTVLGTKTITFYGTVATLSATVLQGIARPGVANGNKSVNSATQATLALTPAVVVVAKDANGVIVPGLTVVGTPADLTIVASSATDGGVTGTTDKNGPGHYNFDVTGGAAANVGKSTTIVYSTTLANGVTKISTAPVTIALAGTPAAVTWALDKTSYTPGEKVTITVSAKDAAGNNAADGTYANMFAGATVLGGQVTGSTPAAEVELVGGKATYTAFAPGSSGSYVISNTLAASAGAANVGKVLTGTIVVGASADMQAVTTLINSLIAKINALNKLVIKIQKKVRA